MATEKTALTLSIQLGKEASGHASAEIDTRPEGINAKKLGRTSDFQGGDKIAVLVYLSDGITIDEKDIFHSWKGKVEGLTVKKGTLGTDDEVKLSEVLKFGNGVSTASVSKPTKKKGTTSTSTDDTWTCDESDYYFCGKWIGYEPITSDKVKLSKDAQTVVLKLDFNAKDAVDKLKPPAFFKCQYTAKAELWEITLPTEKVICDGLKPHKPPYPLEIIMIAKPKKEEDCK
jgi:hypothetical protein